MDLSVVDKPMPAVLMNRDNQTVIAKAKSSKDNMKSTKARKKKIKICQKIEKLRSDSAGLYPDH